MAFQKASAQDSVVITEAILVILVKEVVAVCGENAKRVNTMCGQDAVLHC
jgi:hypothetical protein